MQREKLKLRILGWVPCGFASSTMRMQTRRDHKRKKRPDCCIATNRCCLECQDRRCCGWAVEPRRYSAFRTRNWKPFVRRRHERWRPLHEKAAAEPPWSSSSPPAHTTDESPINGVRISEIPFGFGCTNRIRTVKKIDICADGFPTETACNPQFKLKMTKMTLFAPGVQIKNVLKHDWNRV